MEKTMNVNKKCFPLNIDIKLLNELGLPKWEANVNEEIFIGETFPYKDEKSKTLSIKIWVTCMPAQFYKFIVNNIEDNLMYEVTTGSGSLSKYFPMALCIGEGTLKVKQLYNY